MTNRSSAAASSGVGTAKTASLGLTLTYPLYTGGATQGRIRETLVLEEKARNDLDFARRSVAAISTVAWALINHPDQLDDIASQIAPQAQLDETLVLRAARRVNEQLLAAQEHGR